MSDLGYTTRTLHQLSGVNESTVSRIVRGISTSCRQENLQALAKALNVTVDELTSEVVSVGKAGLAPCYSRADIPAVVSGEGARKLFDVPVPLNLRHGTLAVEMDDDSMEPDIPKGFTVVVEPVDKPEPGSVVLVITAAGDALIRRYVEEGGSKYYRAEARNVLPVTRHRKDKIIGAARWVAGKI